MAVRLAPHLVLSVKDPLGKSGVTEEAVIFLMDKGGTKTAETLNKLVCQHFKISNESEKKMFQAALFSYPHLLDTVKLTRNDGVVYNVSLKGGMDERKKMSISRGIEQDIKLKPEKLLIHTKVDNRYDQMDVHHYVGSDQIAHFGDAAVTFFNCKSFKRLAVFNRPYNISRTMVKIDLTQIPRSKL